MFSKIPIDKLLHLLVCFIIGLVAWLYSGPCFPGWSKSLVIIARFSVAAAFVSVFSVGKEIHDSKQAGNHFCRRDLLWDAIGGILGIIAGVIYFLIS